MTAVPSIIRLNSALPVAPSGYMNVKPQHDGNFPIDDTSFYIPNLAGKDPRTTTSETISIASQGKLVTLTNSGAIAVTLDSTVWNQFFCAVQVNGAGAATFTPSSGLINGVATATINGGSNLGGWLFFDGTNWWLITSTSGGGGSSPLTTKGDLYTYSTANARLAVGADKTVLMADSSQTDGIGWKTARGNTFVPQLADSTTSPTSGNLASFDANGNVKDSGVSSSSVSTRTLFGEAVSISTGSTSGTLSHTPNPTSFLQFMKNGVTLTAGGVDYTLSGTSITLVVAALATDTFQAFYAY